MCRRGEFGHLNRFNAAGLDFAPIKRCYEGLPEADSDRFVLWVLTFRPQTDQYDVVIHMDETRFWVAMLATVASGLAWCGTSVSRGDAKARALRQMGWAILAMQVGYQLYMIFSPSFTYSIHRSLPLHVRHQHLVGRLELFLEEPMGEPLHDVHGHGGRPSCHLDPAVDGGGRDACVGPLLHQPRGVAVCPDCVNRLWVRPFKWGWVKVYGLVAVSSTLMAGINWAINTAFPSEVVANYMYMTEAPKVDNRLCSMNCRGLGTSCLCMQPPCFT